MSETVDRIINDQLNQRPGARHAYNNDPTMHNDIERARSMLTVVEAAMRREGIPYDSAERVLNEVVHVGLEGWEQEKLSRERMLLLADMTADFREIPSGWPEQLTTEQVRTMWHDAMPVPDGPTRTQTEAFGDDEPVSGEETSG